MPQAKEKKVKKRSGRRPGKKPVLTSPWKIGAFVALQLVFLSIGVGYFFVTVYGVQLHWLKAGPDSWGIDSYLFFRQMYPLVAAVVIVSLVSYFLVASAVRRYKCYLDSGQDYRKMVSLAESIDDLTNPAQIARLSSYPELQAILRNYGDSIREISQELGQKEANIDFSELEREIDSLLGGESPDDAFVGKAWESTFRKIRDRFESDSQRVDGLAARSDGDRAVIGRAALAYGRVMEAISGAGEDLLEITKGASELHAAAGETRGAAAPAEDAASQRKASKAIMMEMENAVRKLEEGGHVLYEFSEENNGIALNMALMAAKGKVGEQDLASFAEKVRGTAERFRRLNGMIVSIAQGLLANCYALKEKLGETTPPPYGGGPQVQRKILETVRMVEERSNLLQQRICNLGSELHDVHELLQKDFAVSDAPEAAVAVDAAMPPRPPARAETDTTEAESGLVIDHGKSWGGIVEEKPEAEERTPRRREGSPLESEGDTVGADAAPTSSGESAEAPIDFSDMSSLRDLEKPEETPAASEAPHEFPRHDESWMEMPGHRWLKINVEKSEAEPIARAVSVTAGKSPEPAAGRGEPEAPAVAEAAREKPRPETRAENEGDPVYDLSELGAVEYAEEIQAQR